MGTKTTAPPPPVGGFRQVQGRRIYLRRSGEGAPAVVFMAGAGALGLDYYEVQDGVAAMTTSLLYDRGGTGWSDRIRFPRTAGEATDELRALLAAEGLAPPFILVGHSLGGLYARHYAQRFPGEVAGLVLLDPAHEDFEAYTTPRVEGRDLGGEDPGAAAPAGGAGSRRVGPWVRSTLMRLLDAAAYAGPTRAALNRIPVVARYRELYGRLFEAELKDWPAQVRAPLVALHKDLRRLQAGLQEAQNIEETYEEVRRAGPLPDVPLIILSSKGVDDFRRAVSPDATQASLQPEIDGKLRLYEAMAASVPKGSVRQLDGGHFTLHLRSPDSVVQAVRDLLP